MPIKLLVLAAFISQAIFFLVNVINRTVTSPLDLFEYAMRAVFGVDLRYLSFPYINFWTPLVFGFNLILLYYLSLLFLEYKAKNPKTMQSQMPRVQLPPMAFVQPSNNLSDELSKLNGLFESGALTQAEFKAAKQRIIGS